MTSKGIYLSGGKKFHPFCDLITEGQQILQTEDLGRLGTNFVLKPRSPILKKLPQVTISRVFDNNVQGTWKGVEKIKKITDKQ